MPVTANTNIKTVLFDLDGTLLDTAPDLAFALNQLRSERQLSALDFKHIRPLVSHGGAALIRGGLDMPDEDPEFEPCRQRLLDIYENNLTNQTRLFEGMAEVLEALEAAQIQWGVVTNKPARFTLPIMQQLQLDTRASSIVCGDTLARNKPHPDPILLACQQSDSTHSECVYIGDAQRDIEAGRNANMPTLVALFGYLDQNDQPDTWQADGMVNTPLDILDWLQIKPPKHG